MIKKLIAFLTIVSALFLLIAPSTFAQDDITAELDFTDQVGVSERLLQELIAARGFSDQTNAIIAAIVETGDPFYIAPLLDFGFFVRGAQSPITDALGTLTEQDFGANWQAYFEWASAENIALPENYDRFKGTIFSTLIDPRFEQFFQSGAQDTAEVNMIEAIWGGVRVDGIPSLVNARQISAQEALAEGESHIEFCRLGDCAYPADDEYVFGVAINGDVRAYPLRLLNWHEMFNDVIGSAPLYDAPDGDIVCNFRAPTTFQAVARNGVDWVKITGESAGCPDSGWLTDPENLVWGSDVDGWYEVSMNLPNLLDDDANALERADGIKGQVAGTPIMLSYCTLCGSGILYNPTLHDVVVDGEEVDEITLEFGSTGLLMRSNKLMYDRATDTVWNAMLGTPAWGELAGQNIELERLPVVVSDWATWLEDHPDTSVLSLNTGYDRLYRNGGVYADYFNDPDFIMFPAWQTDTSEQENKEVIFALNINDTPKAYPLKTIVPEVIVNDTLAGDNVVIVSEASPERDFFEPGGATVRAYERGDFTFVSGDSRHEVVDQNGTIWQLTEDALISPNGETLERLPGHLAFWFGWYGFYPETLVYEGSS